MKVIGLSGRKTSGKSSLRRFIIWNANVLFGVSGEGWNPRQPTTDVFPQAGLLKDFCENVLGIPHENLYGTEEQKNEFTSYRWESLPHYHKFVSDHFDRMLAWASQSGFVGDAEAWLKDNPCPSGPMTSRQVMQQVGGMVRMMNPRAWAESCRRAIENSGVDVAISDDVRHVEEIEELHAIGGKVYRLLRCIDPSDTHESETSLDGYDGFDGVIDNREEPLRDSCIRLASLIVSDGLAQPFDETKLDFNWPETF